MRAFGILCSACVTLMSLSAFAAEEASAPSATDESPEKNSSETVKMPDTAKDDSFEKLLRDFQAADRPIPCPNGWVVEANPSADNSLSYMTEDGTLAVSVTSIKSRSDAGTPTEPESYSRVAAEQMGCSIPVRSNLIDGGWTFHCADFKVDGLVYGSKDELVLLGISGREANTEAKLNEFVRFLQYQAAGD